MSKIKMSFKKNKKQLLLIFVLVLIILFLVIKINDFKELKQAKETYNENEFKSTFLITAKELENNVGIYIITSGIENEEDFKKQISTINKTLNKQDWSELEVSNPKILGIWYLNDEANIKFRFLNKYIEPIWIKDPDVEGYIDLN